MDTARMKLDMVIGKAARFIAFIFCSRSRPDDANSGDCNADLREAAVTVRMRLDNSEVFDCIWKNIVATLFQK